MIPQFWKACRFCNKKSLTLVTYANITLVKVIDKISVSISCAMWIVFIRKVNIFLIWYLRSVFPLKYHLMYLVLILAVDRSGFLFGVIFYLSILTIPQLIGDPCVWSLGTLYLFWLYCCTFQYQQYGLYFRDLTLFYVIEHSFLRDLTQFLRDLTQFFTWFNTMETLQQYKIETTVPVSLCETESSEVRFSTIYARSICCADAMLVSVMAEPL